MWNSFTFSFRLRCRSSAQAGKDSLPDSCLCNCTKLPAASFSRLIWWLRSQLYRVRFRDEVIFSSNWDKITTNCGRAILWPNILRLFRSMDVPETNLKKLRGFVDTHERPKFVPICWHTRLTISIKMPTFWHSYYFLFLFFVNVSRCFYCFLLAQTRKKENCWKKDPGKFSRKTQTNTINFSAHGLPPTHTCTSMPSFFGPFVSSIIHCIPYSVEGFCYASTPITPTCNGSL